jgi:hypothetical protein
MASTFAAQPRILPCPSCGEMIYSDTTKCRFCSAPVDSTAAAAAADNQAKVNNACNQAKWIRNMAGAMWAFLAVSLIWGTVNLAVLVLFFLIPLSLIYWQISYGRLTTADPDYKRAKRDRLIALGLWVPAALIEALLITAQVIGA